MITELRELLPTRALCRLLGISAATYYRHQKASPTEKEEGLAAVIEAIVLEYPSYGYRRVTHELRRRQMVVNHKRVLSIMRAQGLLCRTKGKFRKTTDSAHGERRYPNLIKHLRVGFAEAERP